MAEAVVLRKPPSRGRIYACPACGDVKLLQCWHPDTGPLRTVAMLPSKAAKLRREFDGEPDRIEFTCTKCGYSGPIETGMQVGVTLCAACSGWGT